MKKYHRFFLITLICISQNIFAQKYIKMMEDERVNFFEIQKEANQYFHTHGKGKGSGYKPYKRWEYETKLTIDAVGNRPSEKKILRELNKFKQQNPASRQTGSTITWTELGPKKFIATSSWNPGVGRITAIAVDPNNQNLIFVGTPEGGIWRSLDGGQNWIPLTDQLQNIKIYSIAIKPTNSDIIFAGTDYGGMLKSTDKGLTWTTKLSVSGKIRKIIIDPVNNDFMLCASSVAIYRSINGGNTWTKNNSFSVEDIEFKPGNSLIVYAIGDYYYRSTDNGKIFTQMNSTGYPGGDRSLLAVTSADPDMVYIVMASGGVYGSFYRSSNSGLNFTLQHSGSSGDQNLFGYETDGTGNKGQAWYDMAMCVSPQNADEVHIAGIICWKSLDGGLNWNATTTWDYPSSIGYNHADVHVLEYINSTIYSGSDGGIYKSTDQADSWVDLSTGIGNHQFYRFGLCRSNYDVMSGGAQDNGTAVRRFDGIWYDWLGADGMESFVHHTNKNILYGSSQSGSLYKSTNAGNSYYDIESPDSNGNWVTPFTMDPIDPNIIYVGYSQIYKSTDQGSTWSAISNFSSFSNCDDIQIAPSNTQYIYIIKSSEIYYTNDGGLTWTDINFSFSSGIPNSIAILPSDPQNIIIGTSSGEVFSSINSGNTFTNLSGILPQIPINKILFDDTPYRGMFVGMTKGVFYKDSTLSDWNEITSNLPYAPVYDMEYHSASKRIYVATHGRGLWWTSSDFTSGKPFLNTISDAIKIYPNPTFRIINIEIENPNHATVEIKLFNLLGLCLDKRQYANSSDKLKIQMDMQGFGSQIYLLQVRFGETLRHYKIILEK